MNIEKIIKLLETDSSKFPPPLIDQIIKEFGKEPFLILIACLLSLRSKDSTTIHICRDLFKKAQTPQQMIQLSKKQLEKIVFKSGFYKNKAETIHEVSKTILQKCDGKVPKNYEQLISIKGIGPKTTNLILGLAFNIPAICVDTHVHRISNRLGIIKTKTPEETQLALEVKIARKHWIKWNKLLVTWGQNICTPRKPKCKICCLENLCNKNFRRNQKHL